MCRGPHEWTVQELEENILAVQEYIETGRAGPNQTYWEGRLEMMDKLLKEHAEKGTYA